MKTVAKAKMLVTRFPFSSQMGGEEMHTLALMEELDKKGHEVTFLGSCEVLLEAFAKRKFATRRACLWKPPVSLVSLITFTLCSPVLFVLAGYYLLRAKRAFGVDTVYMLSFGEKLLMSPWAKLLGMKMVWLEHARIGNWLTKNPWRHVYKAWSRWATVVVTSNAMKPYLEELVKDVKVIPCGVITDKLAPLPKKLENFLKGGFCVGTVARLTTDKGVDKIARLVHSKPDIRLVIVGEGPLKQELEGLVNAKQVMMIPSLPRPQLMSLYKALDLFILGSMEMDPFGMVAAEAMWWGTPVLMTDQCGIGADLQSGREAMIVEARYSSMDKALKKLMKDRERRERLGRSGQDFVKKNYQFKDMVKAFIKILDF